MPDTPTGRSLLTRWQHIVKGAVKAGRVTKTQQHVLLVLSLYMHTESGVTRVGRQALAEETGLSVRTVEKALAGAVKAGLLAQRYKGSSRPGMVSVYQALEPVDNSGIEPVDNSGVGEPEDRVGEPERVSGRTTFAPTCKNLKELEREAAPAAPALSTSGFRPSAEDWAEALRRKPELSHEDLVASTEKFNRWRPRRQTKTEAKRWLEWIDREHVYRKRPVESKAEIFARANRHLLAEQVYRGAWEKFNHAASVDDVMRAYARLHASKEELP